LYGELTDKELTFNLGLSVGQVVCTVDSKHLLIRRIEKFEDYRNRQTANVACEGPKALDKPPLGVIPKKLWSERRLKELSEAMYRYISVGSRIPEEWVKEYNQILSELRS
jgi:hypothetical protein